MYLPPLTRKCFELIKGFWHEQHLIKDIDDIVAYGNEGMPPSLEHLKAREIKPREKRGLDEKCRVR